MSEPAKYRKKPVVVEAIRWFANGDHPEDYPPRPADDPMTADDYRANGWEGAVVRFFRRPEPEYAGNVLHEPCGRSWHEHGWIDTLEGGHTVCPGDWIITGVQGEVYPCKPDIFDATYEPVAPSLLHDPWDSGCSKRLLGEPSRDDARCPVCRPPTPDLRAQAVEAVGQAIASLVPPKMHGQLCPIWTQHAKHPPITTCDCWVLPNARTDAEAGLAAIWPLATRAALDRADRDVAEFLKVRPGWFRNAVNHERFTADLIALVASLRDGG